MGKEWIGVDLDGTLAYYHGWTAPEIIGDPIPLMLERVQRWIKEGEHVKIFTARACVEGQVEIIQGWLENVGLPKLEVTNIKDLDMVQLWDDRCCQVVRNTGRTIDDILREIID